MASGTKKGASGSQRGSSDPTGASAKAAAADKAAGNIESVKSENVKSDGLNVIPGGKIIPADLTRTFDYGNHDQPADSAGRDKAKAQAHADELQRQADSVQAVKEVNSAELPEMER